jgi:hypothetical protein
MIMEKGIFLLCREISCNPRCHPGVTRTHTPACPGLPHLQEAVGLILLGGEVEGGVGPTHEQGSAVVSPGGEWWRGVGGGRGVDSMNNSSSDQSKGRGQKHRPTDTCDVIISKGQVAPFLTPTHPHHYTTQQPDVYCCRYLPPAPISLLQPTPAPPGPRSPSSHPPGSCLRGGEGAQVQLAAAACGERVRPRRRLHPRSIAVLTVPDVGLQAGRSAQVFRGRG